MNKNPEQPSQQQQQNLQHQRQQRQEPTGERPDRLESVGAEGDVHAQAAQQPARNLSQSNADAPHEAQAQGLHDIEADQQKQDRRAGQSERLDSIDDKPTPELFQASAADQENPAPGG
ncbi:hypothetical protein H696_05867 [Fonticula alba]|uniref:Uncharacterized protein n=1 Tax=Fonticula alba TaxID=691883 RepID=A0A058Z029_FONAL|nr:hypothetical protein H696_05867 [Fonticula alba]KCV67600.1 hypothetical protein H696_05867 [Fonticula alba]|eukprot:XP_009497938.1 hypothetical protein H696_05867 [Fonticula alba]